MAETYQVIVVGGGSSGLMAAINAAQQGASVLILEKNRILGKKLLLSGGGRCNVTNRTSQEELIKHIPGNGKFLYSALSQFDQEDIVNFFADHNVQLKEEDHGRMFPITDRSATIRDALLDICLELGVTIQTKEPVESLLIDRAANKIQGVHCKSGHDYYCKSLILACGGRAYPGTGATGDGYAWAKAAGHSISRLYPTEAPLYSKDDIIQEGSLKGVALREVTVTLWDLNHKAICQHTMDMLFTHFGYSGPAILRTSGHINQFLHETGADTANMTIDLQPELNQDQLRDQAEGQRDKQVLTIIKAWMPQALARVLLSKIPLNPSLAYKQLSHQEVNSLFQLVKAFPISAYKTDPIEKGFVTGGGVKTSEIQPDSMASKLLDGLYFCGEFMDINGYTGDYNISAAFITGTIAGRHAAWAAYEY